MLAKLEWEQSGDTRTCPCGCTMIWHEGVHDWVCLHCDLDEVDLGD